MPISAVWDLGWTVSLGAVLSWPDGRDHELERSMMTSWHDAMAQVQWDHVEHAYGEAGDVPEMLRGLTRADDAHDALSDLWASVLHQGSIYPATAPVVRVLALQLRDEALADPEQGWWFLRQVADSLELFGEDAVATAAAFREATAALRPLLSGEQAADAARIVALAGSLADADREALESLARRRPVDAAAIAAVAGLARHGVACDVADAPALKLVAALVRLRHGGSDPDDIRLVGSRLADARRVFADFEPFTDDDVTAWLAPRNPQVMPEIAALAEPDVPLLRSLVVAMEASRSATRRGMGIVLAGVSRLAPADAIPLLLRLPLTPQTCDALDAAAATADFAGSRLGIWHPAVDAALALAVAGDARWERHLCRVLASSPIGGAICTHTAPTACTTLGVAFREAGVAPGDELLEVVRGVLARAQTPKRLNPQALSHLGEVYGSTWHDQKSNSSADLGVGSLLGWIASWPRELADQLHDETLALLPLAPLAGAEALAAMGHVADAAALRRVAAEHPRAWRWLAHLTGDPADWATLLKRRVPHLESTILEAYPDPIEPKFLEWCRELVGDEPQRSHPGRAQQVAALRHLVAAHVLEVELAWPRLAELIDLPGAVAEATKLALEWARGGSLDETARAELLSLLEEHARAGYEDDLWGGPEYRFAAARAWHDLTGRWPAEPALAAEVIGAVLGYPRLRPAALQLARTLRCEAAQAVAELFRAAVACDGRNVENLGYPIREDDALCAELRAVLQVID